jgi:hypothetical protein
MASGYRLPRPEARHESTNWRFWGFNAFGLSLVPLLVGVGILFFNGRSLAGWFLTAAGGLIIVVGIIANLGIYFQPSSLFDTLIMLGLIAGGVGLVARSLKAAAPVEER